MRKSTKWQKRRKAVVKRNLKSNEEDIEWLVQTISTERDNLRQRFESGKETADESAFNDGRDWALLFVLRLIEHMGEQKKGGR